VAEELCVYDERVLGQLRAIIKAIAKKPTENVDPGEMTLERFISAGMTLIVLDRVEAGRFVPSDTIEHFLMRPTQEIIADMMAATAMSPAPAEEPFDDSNHEAVYAEYLATMDARHAQMLLGMDRALLEYVRSVDVSALTPEQASKIPDYIAHYEKQIAAGEARVVARDSTIAV
jgi:hypothetical protein